MKRMWNLKIWNYRSARALTLCLLLAGACGLVAADGNDPEQGGRAVRLSHVDGQVELSQGGQVLSDTALPNTPIFEGTRLATREEGRAEIQFEDGSIARLSPNSAMILRVLRGAGAQTETEVEVDGGLAYFEIQANGSQNVMRVRFDNHIVTGSGFTVLRVNADASPAVLAVFSGNAHVDGGNGQNADLRGGESAQIDSNHSGNYNLTGTIEPDSWDTWNSDRDQELNAAAGTNTEATQGMPQGNTPEWNDLNANGSWYNVEGDGYVWSPYDASSADWDPYGNGYWGMSGNGPTWISSYSWGYLPYSCGMWNWYDSFGWGWAPGMGGCTPWWGGSRGFAPNIGRGFHGYQPPRPPHDWPHRPRIGHGNEKVSPYPVMTVNRKMENNGGQFRQLPQRGAGNPVTIGGRTVTAMRPIQQRPTYNHGTNGNSHGDDSHGSAAGFPSNMNDGRVISRPPVNAIQNRPDADTHARPVFQPTQRPPVNTMPNRPDADTHARPVFQPTQPSTQPPTQPQTGPGNIQNMQRMPQQTPQAAPSRGNFAPPPSQPSQQMRAPQTMPSGGGARPSPPAGGGGGGHAPSGGGGDSSRPSNTPHH